MLDADYLLVPDYNQQIIYQMIPQSGDMRALPMDPCKPVYLVFDPKIDGVYVTCDTRNHFDIQKKTFDGGINQVIYHSLEGTLVETTCISRPTVSSCLHAVEHSDALKRNNSTLERISQRRRNRSGSGDRTPDSNLVGIACQKYIYDKTFMTVPSVFHIY